METQARNTNTFINEAFEVGEDENDETRIKENNNLTNWSGPSSVVESLDTDDVFDDSQMLKIPKRRPGRDRKVSQICEKVATQNRRKQNLVEIRENILAISHLNTINQAQLQTLLSDRDFCLIFFRLFDDKGHGILEQSVWFGKLKYWYQVSQRAVSRIINIIRVDTLTFTTFLFTWPGRTSLV